jgi:hypothetical protein
MGRSSRHLFICTGERTEGAVGCRSKGAEGVLQALEGKLTLAETRFSSYGL